MALRTSLLLTPLGDVKTMSAVSPARDGKRALSRSKAAMESEWLPLKLSL